MTVAEQTLETFEDDGSELAEFVKAAKASRDAGNDFLACVFDAGYDPAPIMDGLMTLGFSRTWTFDEERNQGTLEVRW